MRLTSVDFGLEILTIHEDAQKALGGAIVEELSKVSVFVFLVNGVDGVVCVHDLR